MGGNVLRELRVNIKKYAHINIISVFLRYCNQVSCLQFIKVVIQ